MSERFDQAVAIMSRLRGEGGCPWDRKQTRESLKPYLIEEAYEVLETIEAQDESKLKEELGDVLLQVLFHATIGQERGTFTIEDVLETLADKLVRRHPHVFAETPPPPAKMTADDVVHRWEDIKRQEKIAQSGNGDAGSALDGVPKALPALLRAYQLQVRAARVGFDWPRDETGYAQVLAKIHEELREVEEARAAVAQAATEPTRQHLQDEIGDLLFTLVNLARVVKVNPEEALRGSANRFATRFTHMEQAAQSRGRTLSEMTLPDMDRLWSQAKLAEGTEAQP